MLLNLGAATDRCTPELNQFRLGELLREVLSHLFGRVALHELALDGRYGHVELLQGELAGVRAEL